jgi:hypothetical protein
MNDVKVGPLAASLDLDVTFEIGPGTTPSPGLTTSRFPVYEKKTPALFKMLSF